MKTEHTPGPWHKISTPHKSAPGPYAIVSTADGHECTICWIDSTAGEFAENASLIAAAPALLAECRRQREEIAELRAALEGLLADITEYQKINRLGGENNHWQVIARVALAKVRP